MDNNYTIAIEKLEDVKNFDALAGEHWADFNDRLPVFNKETLSVGKVVTLRHNGSAVGYLIFMVYKSPFYEEKWCTANMYYVQKSHRGKGFGARMFGALEAYAKSQGCVKLSSSFNKKQPLDGFYEKMGFSATHVEVAKEL